MENPFEALRPVLRSEEDEIRKGVFSQALRNFHQASLEEHRKWCKVIRETMSRSGARAKKALATAAAGESLDKIRPPVSVSSLPQGAPGGSAASASPPASLASMGAPSMQEPDVVVGQKRVRGDSDVSSPGPITSTLSGLEDDTSSLSTQQVSKTASKPMIVGSQSSLPSAFDPADERQLIGAAASDSVDEETEGSVKECIAAYMRSLLDRVVGTGIDNLAVPALKVLCMMLGIHTEVSNKMGLYSILADFYFSKCAKLGKRVSRDTVFQRHVDQEVAMLKQVTSASAFSARSEKKAVTSGSERAAQTAEKLAPAAAARTAKAQEKREAVVERRKTLSAPLPKPNRASKTAAQPQPYAASEQRYHNYENNNDGALEDNAEVGALESTDGYGCGIIYDPPVFTQSSKQKVASSHIAMYKEPGAGAEENGSWSVPLLERKVASIVQLYDPVTVAIVVKKLSQMGYRENGAEIRVEQVLQRFHERQLIFYDNGIAYLM